jgi:hypothetical protein
MQADHPWHEAAVMAGVQIGRSAAYQLLHNVRLRGEAASCLIAMTADVEQHTSHTVYISWHSK